MPIGGLTQGSAPSSEVVHMSRGGKGSVPIGGLTQGSGPSSEVVHVSMGDKKSETGLGAVHIKRPEDLYC